MEQIYSHLSPPNFKHIQSSIPFTGLSSSSSIPCPSSKWRKIIVYNKATKETIATYELDEKAHLIAKLQRQRRRNLGKMTGKKTNLRSRKRALKKLEELYPEESSSSSSSSYRSPKESTNRKPMPIVQSCLTIPCEPEPIQSPALYTKPHSSIAPIHTFSSIVPCYITSNAYYSNPHCVIQYSQPYSQPNLSNSYDGNHHQNFPVAPDLSSINWLLNKSNPIYASES